MMRTLRIDFIDHYLLFERLDEGVKWLMIEELKGK